MSGRQDDDAMTARGPEGLDPRLERALHDVLGARDPGPAPVGLRDRVESVPTGDPARSAGERRLGRLALGAVAVAAVVLVAAIVGPLLGTRTTGPGAGASPGTTPLDGPLLVGPAGVAGEGPNLLLTVMFLAVTALAGAAILLHRQRGRRAAAVPLVGVTLLGAWAALGLLAPVGLFVSFAANGSGMTANPNGSSESNLYFVTARPGAPFSQQFAIRSTGLIPFSLEGVLADSGDGPWEALWRTEPGKESSGKAWQPLATPVTVGAGDLGLWLYGVADPCAIAEFDPAGPSPDVLTSFEAARIRLRIAVLGIPRTVELPEQFWPMQPLDASGACNGSTP